MNVIYNKDEQLFFSYEFSWCNLKLASRFTDEERGILGSNEDVIIKGSMWMTEEEAEEFEAIPWVEIII
jgi:hypothetical protein